MVLNVASRLSDRDGNDLERHGPTSTRMTRKLVPGFVALFSIGPVEVVKLLEITT
jgi:hypothetical protein